MRRALRKDHLFLAAQHADNAADAAALISEESGDRADTAAAATEMKSLAMDMKEAAKHGKSITPLRKMLWECVGPPRSKVKNIVKNENFVYFLV